MRRIIVINSKGGCGKTTIATNLAGYYANRNGRAALVDHDPQGSSVAWLSRRDGDQPPIHGVSAFTDTNTAVTRSFRMRVPSDTENVILDTPASMKPMELMEILRGTSAILVPILPSTIDRHVTFDFMEQLLRMARQSAPTAPIGLIANRVRANTLSFRNLKEELAARGLPLVAQLRDTQNYVTAAERGVSIHELEVRGIDTDKEQWQAIERWLEPAHHPFSEIPHPAVERLQAAV